MPETSAPARAIRLGVLGQPTLAADDEPPRLFAGRRPLRALAYLLLHRRGPVLRESATVALWPDDDPEAAYANLRRHLYLLAQALPPSLPGFPWILTGSDRLQINPEARISVDADDFERLAEAGSPELAVDAYGGDLFESLYDDWVTQERERLRLLYHTCLNDLTAQYRRRRDFAKATDYAQRLLLADPWREDVIRQLMSVRYEAGDSAGAISAYDAFESRVRGELGVAPMQETLALREAIAAGRAIDEAPVAASKNPAATRPLEKAALPFVGRRADLDRLVERWDAAAHGRGGVAAVSGEAGIGKTRLVREIAAHASAHGGRVLYGTTGYPELQPYEGIAEAMRSALLLVASLDAPHALSNLAQIVPELASKRDDLAAPAHAGIEDRQHRLFESISAIFRALAKPRPLVLILEDLHWAGGGTLDALRYVACRIADAPILIVVTYREEEVGRMHALRTVLRALRAEAGLTELSLGALSETDVREIVGERIARQLFERSEGNPLFLNELIGAGLSVTAQAHESVPHGIRSTVSTRVARLSPAARSFAEIASVAGSGFDVEVIREVTGWANAQATSALDELLSHRLVRELAGHHGARFSFSHQLVQDAIYRDIGASDRASRHRRIATVVEELYAGRLPDLARELARHCELGGDPAAASRYYLLAAERAVALYAYDEAIDALDRALEHAGDDGSRRPMLLLRERAFGQRGRRDDQRADLDELERIARACGDEELSWEVRHRRCSLAAAEGDVALERSLVAILTERASATGNLRWQADAAKQAATFALVAAYDYGACREAATRALELRMSLDDSAGAIEALCILSKNEMLSGSWQAAADYAERAHARATSEQSSAMVARATLALAEAAASRQDFGAYRDLATKALGIFRAVGYAESIAATVNGIGAVCAFLGELTAAREYLTEAQELFASIGVRRGVNAAEINLGIIAWMLGELGPAYDLLSHAREEAIKLDFSIGRVAAATTLSGVARMLDRYDEALQLAGEAAELARRSKLPLHEASALLRAGGARLSRGDIAGGIADLEAAVALFGDSPTQADEVEARAELAAAYLRCGDVDRAFEATEAFLRAPEQAFTASAFPQTYHWTAARVYRAAGREELARAQVEAARRCVERRLQECHDDAARTFLTNMETRCEFQ